MTNKLKVKVVKKSAAAAPSEKPAAGRTKRMAARDMVSTVTDWVTEFKARKSDETKTAFDQFFNKQPQPNES